MTTIAHAAAAHRDEDRLPFEHALGLALASHARLVSVHAGNEPDVEARLFGADEILRAWSHAGTVVHDKLVHTCCDDPVDTTLDVLRRLQPDLVVVGTHARTGVARWMMASRAEALAENLPSPTLVVPIGARPFVDRGELRLRRVLVPAGDAASTKAACEALTRLLSNVSLPPGEVMLLKVGTSAVELPELPLPEGWLCRVKRVEGPVAEAITEAAQDADLVVMATRGQDSFFDALVGTHTERVFHASPCPVLAVPFV